MAQRRMFSKEITNSSDFQMMSPSAQALYLHIGMNADDDGFCEVFTIVRMTESKPDDLRSLHEKGLVFLVDSKVGIVKDWHTNNDIRVDRYTPSKYLTKPQYADVYKVIMEDKIKHLSRYKDMLPGITDGTTSGTTQVRLGKGRLQGEFEDEHRRVLVSDEEQQTPKTKPKYPNARKAFAWFPFSESSWSINTTELKHGELLFGRGEEAVRGILKYVAKHQDDDYFPKVTKPSDLERKWKDIQDFAKKN